MNELWQFANNNPGTTLLIVIVLAVLIESVALAAFRSKKRE